MIGPETKQIRLICNHLKPSSEVGSQSVEIHTVLDDLLTPPPPLLSITTTSWSSHLNVTKQNKIILFWEL